MIRFVFVLLLCSCARPTPQLDLPPARCLGPYDGHAFAVYLHGMDTPELSAQEVHNRSVLMHLSEALSMRIALPRATATCQAQLCWGWTFDDREVDAATAEINRTARECFGDKDYVAIGFSNGGYLLDKIYRGCEMKTRLPHARWLFAVGAALLKGPLEAQPESLAGCGALTLLSGSEDRFNTDPEDNFLHRLQAKHADVRAIRYAGGHELVEAPLGRALSSLAH
jgi:hypothetical protein